MHPFNTVPRHSLGFLPTPLVRLKNLEKLLGGPRILMKRDDQTGLGLGGNKTRKLEFLLGDALLLGADCIVTAGAAQSNHCRQTAAAAAVCGMQCHLALGGSAPELINGNLLLDILFGAQLHWSGEKRKGENIPAIVEELKRTGKKPYIIPYGGSNEIGATGFVAALFELQEQLEKVAENISHIVFASSSGGTHSGMIVAKKLLQQSYNLVGINIDKDEIDGMTLHEYILTLADKTADHLKITGSQGIFTQKDINLNSNYIGEGYGIIGDLEREAIELTARHEGILLDPVYTGRAMGGMIDMIRKGQITSSDNVLFWHTGGSPALFAHAADLL